MRTSGIDRVWLTPEDVRASEDALAAIADAELIVLGPGSLYTSLLPSLLIPDDPRRGRARAGAAHLRLQRRDPGRGDDRLRPRRPRRGARSPTRPRRSSTSCWPTTSPAPVPVRRPSTAPARGRAALAAVVRAGPAAHPRRRRRPGARPPPRPGPARRGDHPRLRGRGRHPAPDDRPHGEPERLSAAGSPAARDGRRSRVTRSERDLVTALRDELAAIDPSRPCDRVAEVDGLGPAPTGREASVARLAHPARAVGEGECRRRPFAWDSAAEHCHAAWLRGRFLARGSLSLAGGRTHLEFVVEPAEAPELAARLTEFGLPVSWRIRRGRGVVTSKNGEAVGTFLRRIGASGALLESRRARSRGPCAASSTGSSTPSRRTSSARSAPPAASSTRSRRSRPTGASPSSRTSSGWSPTRAARRRRRASPSSPNGSRSIARPSSARSSGSSAWRPSSPSRWLRLSPSPLWHDSADARRHRGRQLEDAHDPGRRRRPGARRSRRGPGWRA